MQFASFINILLFQYELFDSVATGNKPDCHHIICFVALQVLRISQEHANKM